jgi:hypothetical protein
MAATGNSWLEKLIAEQLEIGRPLSTVMKRVPGGAGFLERPYEFVSEESRVGQQIGAYMIESLLGQSRMGEVWLAKRNDGRFKGSYAVKFLWTMSRPS